MPPEFEKNLKKIGIPFETRGKNTYVPITPQAMNQMQPPSSDAGDFTQRILKIAESTDGRFGPSEPEYISIVPK